MRGFQPATKNYADGGMVSRIKGALGLGGKDDKKKEQATSPAPSPAPAAPAPAPATAQEPSTALGQYSAGSALKRRMAEIDSYADGGPVRGPGTGTSDEVQDKVAEGTYIMPTDSTKAIGEQQLATMGKGAKVPVNLSNGEFKMPPEQVHAVGVQALNAMKNATHTPVAARGFAPGAQQGGEPPLFFADGGVVEEETKPRIASVPASMQRRENTTFEQPAAPAAPRPARDPGIASAAMALPQDNAPTFASMAAQGKSTPPMPVAAPLSAPTQPTPSEMGVAVPPSPDNIFPGNRLNGASGFSGAPIRNSDLAPAAPPAPPVARNPAVTSAAMGLPQDNGPEMFSTPQMRASLSVPKPPAPPAPQPDAMAGMAATGFNPNITAKAERPPAGVPSAPPQSNAGVYMGNPNSATAEFVSEASADAGRRWDQGDVAGAIGAGLRTGIGAVSIGAVEALDNTVGAAARGIWDGGGRLLGGLIGSQAQATPATAPAAPAAPANQPAAARPAGESTAGAGRGRINPPLVKPDAAAPTSSKPSATEVAPGVFRSGNSFADSAELAVAGAQPRGLPSAQNIAAADALSARSQQESMARVQGQMAAQQNAQANGPEALRARGLAMLASREIGSVRRARVLLDAADRLDATTNTRNGQSLEMQRSMLAQQGETSRANARNAIDQGRLDLEKDVRGFDINAGQRMEKLQQKYVAAKTNEERSAIAKQIRDLSGKTEPTNRFTVVPGGQEWDTTAGAMRNVPARVIDNQTGQFIDSTGVQRGMPPPVDSPQVQAIKNNTALTIEQRREELKKLGFKS